MFKREFKINFISLLIWTVCIVATYVLIFAIYPSLMNEETKQSMSMVMESMPQEMLSAFNMDIVGIESAYGWFKTEGYTVLVLIGALYTAILGSTILVKEENDKTIEFLSSKPISRIKMVTSKILAGVVNILIFTFTITVVNLIALKGTEGFDCGQFMMISLIPMLLYFMCFFISLFLSTFFKKTKKAMAIGIAIVLGSYIMQFVGMMGEKVEILKKISLFEFASSRYIILNNYIDMKYLLIGCGIIILSIIGTYYKYNKKEFI